MLNNILNRFLGTGINSISLKDILDKLESYLGGAGLLAAFIWDVILLNASFNQLTKSPPILKWFMVPINVGIKKLLGVNGLWWIVIGLCLILNLTIVARKSKTGGVLEIFLLWVILYEYTYGMKIPAGAWVLAGISAALVVVNYLVVPIIVSKGHAVNPTVRRILRLLSRIGILILVLVVIFAITTREARGVMIATLVPVCLRAWDLWFHNN